jgi:hypothetical protein
MNKAALALVLVAVAIAAPARAADRTSLLQCGVNLGGESLTYSGAADTTDKQDKRWNHVQGAVASSPAQFTPATASEAMPAASQDVDKRLPPNFTVATIGCAWR